MILHGKFPAETIIHDLAANRAANILVNQLIPRGMISAQLGVLRKYQRNRAGTQVSSSEAAEIRTRIYQCAQRVKQNRVSIVSTESIKPPTGAVISAMLSDVRIDRQKLPFANWLAIADK